MYVTQEREKKKWDVQSLHIDRYILMGYSISGFMKEIQ
jgi:hypothetical protein